jgi:hypothetical protein
LLVVAFYDIQPGQRPVLLKRATACDMRQQQKWIAKCCQEGCHAAPRQQCDTKSTATEPPEPINVALKTMARPLLLDSSATRASELCSGRSMELSTIVLSENGIGSDGC